MIKDVVSEPQLVFVRSFLYFIFSFFSSQLLPSHANLRKEMLRTDIKTEKRQRSDQLTIKSIHPDFCFTRNFKVRKERQENSETKTRFVSLSHLFFSFPAVIGERKFQLRRLAKISSGRSYCLSAIYCSSLGEMGERKIRDFPCRYFCRCDSDNQRGFCLIQPRLQQRERERI